MENVPPKRCDTMLADNLLSNKHLPDHIRKKAAELLENGEKPLFSILGDLDLDAKYGESAIVVTDKRFIAFDVKHKDGVICVHHSDVKKAYVKRMYGNAMLKVELGDKKLNIIRFTYSIAVLCDAVAVFIEAITNGKDIEEEYEVVAATFEKMASTCPKCGRTLQHQGAQCINCTSKGKIIAKLSKYIIPQKIPLSICLFLSIITTAVTLAPPQITKMLIDDIIPNKNRHELMLVVVALFVIYIILFTFGGIRGHIMRVTGDKIVSDLRNDTYRKAQHLPLSFYDKTSTGSIINRISGDTAVLQGFMLRITQDAIVNAFLLFGIMIIMLIMNWKLAFLSLAPVPIVVVGARYFGKKISPVYHRIWRRWAAVVSTLTDTLPGIRIIKSFTGEEKSTEQFESYNKEWLKEDTKASAIVNAYPAIVTFIVTCGSLLIWSVGGNWTINSPKTFSLGLLIQFLTYASMFYGPVSFFANLNDSYQGALISTEKILDIIDAEPEADFGKGNKMEVMQGKIEFRNVSFSFDKTKKILNNINLVIKPGEIIGIVGTTGSGKSTLVNLLMRFYDNYEGEILVDDQNIKDIDLESFRSKIGYVQQEPMMFRDTIYKNIGYSKPDAYIEEVIHAADVANAHNFISVLPDSYDTKLGERGIGISGGERQRISIARAVLKNPSMLIFDEATSAVDSETEFLIQQAIEKLISGRTTLMIAHRLSTLRKANKIIVMDKGEIIENGSHDELMVLKGKYFKLIEIQSLTEKIRETKEAENFE
jgi:ATP-binding cassette subfamily B protein